VAEQTSTAHVMPMAVRFDWIRPAGLSSTRLDPATPFLQDRTNDGTTNSLKSSGKGDIFCAINVFTKSRFYLRCCAIFNKPHQFGCLRRQGCGEFMTYMAVLHPKSAQCNPALNFQAVKSNPQPQQVPEASHKVHVGLMNVFLSILRRTVRTLDRHVLSSSILLRPHTVCDNGLSLWMWTRTLR
jgi:hypothetical protein